jgi:hypothetical protein
MSMWMVLDRHLFSLLPGAASPVDGEALNYYQYLNSRHQETGKNVQCVDWLLREGYSGASIEEPFGGCRVFAVAVQGQLKPKSHRVIEIDASCATQLRHCLAGTNAEVLEGDARELCARQPADVFICDFPYFTFTRYTQNGEWAAELERMAELSPRAILITDGSACRYHLVAKALQARGHDVTEDHTSYVRLMSDVLWSRTGYSITGCAWHGTCFYFRAEPVMPGEAELMFFPAGSGRRGLRRLP